MIENRLKEYFASRAGDLQDRQVRVWQKIQRHIIESESHPVSADLPVGLNFGLKPLSLAFVLVLLGGLTVNGFNGSLPGDRLYALKTAVEEAQLKLAPSQETKMQMQIALIQKRAEQVAKIESKIERGEKITEKEKIAVEQIKHEVGKAALEAAAVAVVEAKPAAEAPANSLVYAAEAKVVGEAITQFLKSTELTGFQKTEKILEITKQKVEEAETAAKTETTKPVVEKPATKPAATPAETTPTTTPTPDQEPSKIEGEVSTPVQVVEEK